MKTTLLLFFAVVSIPLFSQYTIHFDASGKLTGEPPEKLNPKESLDVVLNLSEKDIDALVSDIAKRYLSLYKSLEFADSFFGESKATELRNECLYKLYQIQSLYPDHLDEMTKVELVKTGNITGIITVDPKTTNFPDLKFLLNATYTLDVIQLDINGRRLGTSTQILSSGNSINGISVRYTLPDPVRILKEFDHVEIQLRKQNSNWEFFQKKKPWVSPNFSNQDREKLKKILEKSEIIYSQLDSIGTVRAKREISNHCDSLITELLIRFPGYYVKADFQKYIDSIFTKKKAAAFNWTAIFNTQKTTEKHRFNELNLDNIVKDYILDYNLKIESFNGDLKAKNQKIDESNFKVFLANNPKFKVFSETFSKYAKYNDFDALYAKAKVQYALHQGYPNFNYDSEFISEIEGANGVLSQNILPRLEQFNREASALLLQEAVIQQLWLSNSGWSELNIIQKVKPIVGGGEQAEKNSLTIESLTAEIAVIQAQINYLDNLSKNLTVHTKGDSLPAPDHYLKLIKELQTKKDAKTADLKKLEKSSVPLVASSIPLAAKLGLETSDFLLNKVVFSTNLMHHIDFTEKQFMNKQPVKEINEQSVLDVFVHNDKAVTTYTFQYSFEKIDKDITVMEEEMTFNNPESNPGSNDPKVFLMNYLLLKIYREVTASQFTAIPPNALPRSEKPRFQTNDVNAKIKPRDIMEVPGKITYTVLNPINNRDTIAQGAYRINKLYRFRYKIGPSYSWLTQRDYTLNDDQTFTLDEKNAGLQTVFGLQIYLGKGNDIRKQNWKQQFFLFTGMNIGPNIVENFYVGAGWEIIDGMSITAGAHFGMTEKLYSRNGILAIDNRAWTTPAPFITLGFDHGIFNALFKNKIRTDAISIVK